MTQRSLDENTAIAEKTHGASTNLDSSLHGNGLEEASAGTGRVHAQGALDSFGAADAVAGDNEIRVIKAMPQIATPAPAGEKQSSGEAAQANKLAYRASAIAQGVDPNSVNRAMDEVDKRSVGSGSTIPEDPENKQDDQLLAEAEGILEGQAQAEPQAEKQASPIPQTIEEALEQQNEQANAQDQAKDQAQDQREAISNSLEESLAILEGIANETSQSDSITNAQAEADLKAQTEAQIQADPIAAQEKVEQVADQAQAVEQTLDPQANQGSQVSQEASQEDRILNPEPQTDQERDQQIIGQYVAESASTTPFALAMSIQTPDNSGPGTQMDVNEADSHAVDVEPDLDGNPQGKLLKFGVLEKSAA